MTGKTCMESGRTLLELIVVFVIICLLTIGGIYLFQDAVSRQEADRTYEDIMTTATAIRTRGAGRTNTGSGIADTQLVSDKTRLGRKMQVVSDCPQKAFTIKIDDINQKTCEYLMAKSWGKPFQPLVFFRAQNFEDVCQENALESDTTGYYMMSGADCKRAAVSAKAVFAVSFDLKGRAPAIRACHSQGDCLACQSCNEIKQVCEDHCEAGKVCSPQTEICEEEIQCEENQYPEDGECKDCPSQTSCDADKMYDIHGCPIEYQACEEGSYCDGDTCQVCPEPSETICEGAPATDVHGCPTQKFQACETGICKDKTTCVECLTADDCPSEKPICNRADNTCYCPDKAICPDPNNPDQSFACQAGYCPSGETCTMCSCVGYPLTSCPTGGRCSECLSGGSTKYKLDGCDVGYTQSGDTCVANECAGWSITSSITGCLAGSETTCTTPTTSYYKCSACEPGYTLLDDSCTENVCTSTVTIPIANCKTQTACTSPTGTYYTCSECEAGYELSETGEECTVQNLCGDNQCCQALVDAGYTLDAEWQAKTLAYNAQNPTNPRYVWGDIKEGMFGYSHSPAAYFVGNVVVSQDLDIHDTCTRGIDVTGKLTVQSGRSFVAEGLGAENLTLESGASLQVLGPSDILSVTGEVINAGTIEANRFDLPQLLDNRGKITVTDFSGYARQNMTFINSGTFAAPQLKLYGTMASVTNSGTLKLSESLAVENSILNSGIIETPTIWASSFKQTVGKTMVGNMYLGKEAETYLGTGGVEDADIAIEISGGEVKVGEKLKYEALKQGIKLSGDGKLSMGAALYGSKPSSSAIEVSGTAELVVEGNINVPGISDDYSIKMTGISPKIKVKGFLNIGHSTTPPIYQTAGEISVCDAIYMDGTNEPVISGGFVKSGKSIKICYRSDTKQSCNTTWYYSADPNNTHYNPLIIPNSSISWCSESLE
ncbi:MAG: hypothetical protein ACI4OR_04180 [Alphaproteobacteria bacterium]